MKHSGRPSWRARAAMSCMISSSLIPAGISGRACTRRLAGISSNSASMLGAPMTASISRTSSSVWGLKGMLSCAASAALRAALALRLEYLVFARRQQAHGLHAGCGTQAKQPAACIGLAVDQLGGLLQLAVDRHDCSCDRRVDIGGGLDRLDHRACFSNAEVTSDIRQLDEHQVAERALSMIADADLHRPVRQRPEPLMTAGEPQIFRDVTHAAAPPDFLWIDRNQS